MADPLNARVVQLIAKVDDGHAALPLRWNEQWLCIAYQFE